MKNKPITNTARYSLTYRKYTVIFIVLCIYILMGVSVFTAFPLTVGAFTVGTSVNAGGDTLKSGLVGHWTFDGADLVNNVADKSGNGNVGSMINFAATSTAKTGGVLGQALKFDGVNDYIDLGDTVSQSGSFSICSWANPSS